MADTSCPFCAIIMGGPARVVYRDDHAVAFFPLRPAALGHTLVVPRQHIPNIWELPEQTAAHLSRTVLRVAALGSRCYGPYLAGSSPQLPSAGA